MTISIGDVSVSIPKYISEWAKESDDNRTEFDGMIESIMYAVNKVVKERNHVTPNPFQDFYESILKIGEEAGLSKDFVDSYISESSKDTLEKIKNGNNLDIDSLKNALEILKKL